jgi:hypothetical protein
MLKPFFRRPSLKGMAGKAIKCLYTMDSDGTTIQENVKNIYNIITQFGENMIVTRSTQEDKLNWGMKIGDKTCTGIVCLFQTSDPEVRHFIPYIKIGNTWYNGDNEVGFLRKREGPPTKQSKIINDRGIENPDTYVVSAILLYCDLQRIELRTKDWSGRLVFGQLGLSCGPDALQTVLMFADGFYERFNLQLYTEIKHYIDPRFSYDRVIANPYSLDDMVVQQIKLSKELEQRRTNTSYINKDSLEFVAYMFIRYYAIETSPPLEYTPQENSIRNDMPDNNWIAYSNAIHYIKTHNENNNNWKKSSKYVEDFIKLYPDFIPPLFLLQEKFKTLMRKLYDVYAKTPEGNGRLGRVLLMIYHNLNLRHGETVKTKMITRYHEIVDEYAKEHPGEMTEFEEGEYDLLLEFNTFFEDNWKTIMENLSKFQEEYDIIKAEKEREKNSKQRKTRKMRKSRNSKSRKLRSS